MARSTVDAVVVGAGPAGSTAAFVLARGGARVALVDKATFSRDKACGDLVGPRALALLASFGLTPPAGRDVGEMIVVGPTGRRVLLPARAGRTYPGHGVAITRLRFDAWLRDAAIAAGAEPVAGRVAAVRAGTVEFDDGRRLAADVVIGADGATSVVAAAAGLVDPEAVLWGFAQRSYVDQEVERPIIALWDEAPGHGFPGYGWLFPGEAGAANVGLGLGLGSDRSGASRAVTLFDAFCDHLRRLGLLSAPVVERRLGGWLKMGMVGTVAARGRTFLVGDAAGHVNPLQGEGIAPAMTAAANAADAILTGPGTAALRYRQQLAAGPGRYTSVAAPLHAAAISGSPRRVALLGRAMTLPGVGAAIASPWALTWNDLLDGASPGRRSWRPTWSSAPAGPPPPGPASAVASPVTFRTGDRAIATAGRAALRRDTGAIASQSAGLQLDAVTGRIGEERLAARADRLRIGHVDPPVPQLGDGGIEIGDRHREVLTELRRRRGLDEVHLLVAGIEPGATEAERRPVAALGQPEHVDVEPPRRLHVVDVDGHVVQPERFHGVSLARGFVHVIRSRPFSGRSDDINARPGSRRPPRRTLHACGRWCSETHQSRSSG